MFCWNRELKDVIISRYESLVPSGSLYDVISKFFLLVLRTEQTILMFKPFNKTEVSSCFIVSKVWRWKEAAPSVFVRVTFEVIICTFCEEQETDLLSQVIIYLDKNNKIRKQRRWSSEPCDIRGGVTFYKQVTIHFTCCRECCAAESCFLSWGSFCNHFKFSHRLLKIR